jgi:hypothetical protein
MLRFVFRTEMLIWSLSGITPVEVEGVENVDVGDIVEGHVNYADALPAILGRLGLQGKPEEEECVHVPIVDALQTHSGEPSP